MTLKQLNRISPYILSIVLFSIAPNALHAQGFLDDFSDGSATDGTPVTWDPSWSGAALDVVDNSLVISGAGFASAWTPERYTDVSVRAQMRLLEGGGLGLQTRITIGAPVSNYFGTLTPDGTLYLGGNEPGVGFFPLAETETSLDPLNEDVMMRMDAIGPEIRLWAWRAEDGEMPTQPLLIGVDDRATSGFVAADVGSENNLPSSAAFRFIEVIPIPEPSAAVLSFLGLACLFGWLGKKPPAE